MGRGNRGFNSQTTTTTAIRADRKKRNTEDGLKKRNSEIDSWKTIVESRSKISADEYLQSFIDRLETVDWKKADQANITRHPEDQAEDAAAFALKNESRDFQVLSNIYREHKINKGFKTNPEQAPKSVDYKNQDIFALSRSGRESLTRRNKAEAAEKAAAEMSLKEFSTEMKKADWMYSYSDDAQVYRKGKASVEKIEKLAQGNPEREKLLAEFKIKLKKY